MGDLNRNEFLAELRRRLAHLPQDEIDRTISYFSEILDDREEDGMSETEAVASLRSIDEIVADLTESKQGDSTDTAAAEHDFDGETITAIRVNDVNSAVILRRSGDGHITLDYHNTEKKRYEVGVVGGVLTVRAVMNLPTREYFGIFGLRGLFGGVTQPIIVSIPATFDGAIELTTRNAHIEASSVALTRSLTLATSNSHVDVRDLSVGGALKVSSSNARITLDNVNAVAISASTSNARCEASNVRADGDLTLTTSNSRISAEHIAAAKIVLRTSNSRVSGTIEGAIRDYSVRSRTSNGSSNLPTDMGGGDKSLDVHTSNGTIDVRFTQ
ncbi:MAG: hypothetical protein LBN02_02570 [Oscillospiraceae bacterium]|jgi:hypothetical protein|nr:hypothetical protein [Oscillospiraceae bacterium]